jgi:hypothetical protein
MFDTKQFLRGSTTKQKLKKLKAICQNLDNSRNQFKAQDNFETY